MTFPLGSRMRTCCFAVVVLILMLDDAALTALPLGIRRRPWSFAGLEVILTTDCVTWRALPLGGKGRRYSLVKDIDAQKSR